MKNINRVVAAKFYWNCKRQRNKLALVFVKAGKRKCSVENKIVDRACSLKLVMAIAKKEGLDCIGAVPFDKQENATLFTTCRMRITEGMFNKVLNEFLAILIQLKK